MEYHLIFVYGTLKQGFSRHHYIKEQKYLGIARTEPKYAMFAYGGFPALVDEKLAALSNHTATNKIYGELYQVDDMCMRQLDIIEGTDEGLFERKNISLLDITLTGLPTNDGVWKKIAEKTAQAYFFKQNLKGAADRGTLWC